MPAFEWSKAYDFIDDPVLCFRTSGALSNCNKAAEKLPDAWVNALFLRLQAIAGDFSKLSHEQRISFSFSGDKFAYDCRVTCIRRGRGCVFFCHLCDVSERETLVESIAGQNRLALLGLSLSGIIHDVNNAVTGISTTAQMIRGFLAGEHKMGNDVDMIIMAAKRCQVMNENLLHFAANRDPHPHVTQSIAVNDVVLQVKDWVDRTTNRGEKVQILLRLCSESTAVFASATEIFQALINVVNNAIDAAQNHGNELVIKTRVIEKKPRLKRAKIQFIEMSVVDNGCGMNRDQVKKLFEPFRSSKGTNGFGLGMYVVSQTIARLGGEIAVTSKVEKGTSIALLIPAKPTQMIGKGRNSFLKIVSSS